MSQLIVDFEFEVGDLVYFKSATHNKAECPRKFLIVERMAQECPGGIQKQYLFDQGNPGKWTNEIALTKECPPYEPKSEDNIRAMEAERKAEMAAIKWKDD